jgi:type IV pilus assembly protein PilM
MAETPRSVLYTQLLRRHPDHSMASKKSIITLNIGSQRVGMGLFGTTSKGGLILQNYQFAELLGDPATDAARIPQVRVAVNDLAERMGVKNQHVRYAISGHSVFSRFVKLPALDEDQVEQIVEFEAQQNVPFPIDEVVWDYQLVESGAGGEVEVVLVAIKSDAMTEINDAVEDSGLLTMTVDVAPMAIYNAFRYNNPDVSTPVVLIDVGARTTNLIYMDGGRVFTRSIPVGGTASTAAIAKEFEIGFADAEERKKTDGFVALGGGYADHEDPEIATMSKVIRNTMTRLHAEIVRTTSAFRQQGGGAPQVAYLCGGSASLPYLREFFNEKLNIPVEYFNPVTNITIGPKVDAEHLGAEAHTLAELVGLALRDVASCPMEIDLVPERVEARKDLERRKPFLITAGVGLLAMLAAGGVYFAKAKSLTAKEFSGLKAEYDTLSGFATKIRKEDNALAEAREKNLPLETAVFGRTRQVELLNYLNSHFSGDKIWITQIEPTVDGIAVENLNQLYSESAERLFGFEEPNAPNEKNPPKRKVINGLRIYGLYRDNVSNVFQFEESLRKDKGATAMFDIENKKSDEILEVQSGKSGEIYAEMFQFQLPLKETIYTN